MRWHYSWAMITLPIKQTVQYDPTLMQKAIYRASARGCSGSGKPRKSGSSAPGLGHAERDCPRKYFYRAGRLEHHTA